MIRDLGLGLRLAVGGGRISGQALLRLAMTTLGVAMAVTVLLTAASVVNVVDAQQQREAGQVPVTEPTSGVDPLYHLSWFVDAGEEYVQTIVVAPTGDDSPVPPGLDRLPEPGEIVASPAAAEFLTSPEGQSARARIDGTVVGEIAKAGLAMADDLLVYVGATPEELRTADHVDTVYAFGAERSGLELNVTAAALVAPLAVVLLLPLLVFVTTASRMGAAQRERRLAALRLMGVSTRQVRRIAAAESLLGAVAGLVLGGALFAALRPLLGRVELFGLRFFAEDVVPPVVAAVVIAVLVPALAVGAAVFGLRHVVVEPLGVVRQGQARRRRMGWRWVLAGLGAALMVATLFVKERSNSDLVGLILAAGSGLLLISVAALLPWAVEKLVARLHGGSPAWQLAIRRLQLEGGTASRVVSGLVVVLAGAILVQTLVAAASTEEPQGSQWQPTPAVAAELGVPGDRVEEARRLLADTAEDVDVHHLTDASLATADGASTIVRIGDCAALATLAQLDSCADGDVFVVGVDGESHVEHYAGEPMRFVEYTAEEPQYGPTWTVPGDAVAVPEERASRFAAGSILATPAALGGIALPSGLETLTVTAGGDRAAAYHAVAAAISPLKWDVTMTPGPNVFEEKRIDDVIATMKGLLLTASLFVLAVAALSLLLLSIEQIVARRRPLAALSASGVPVSVLARSALWQNAVPVVVGVVLAVVAGLAVTLPTLRYIGLDLTVDLGLLAVVCGAAVVAVLVTTALSLPLLRQATRLEALRSE
ncbi:FtsX-like permease family protein [Saccharomonospora sp. NB11]|jgi:hypothetical protein|uniref:FtsX-like permease family protein n=1 Tax=Saccharomonospora sp. NB11 TaxID=1642298 RepID=UPI0018D13F36|nr:FtsX-like permease family protein [Saccharomonospora sp. NB11]